MLLELHCHTSRHSGCSDLDPVTALREAVDRGLQGLLITEHCYQWTDDELRALREQAGIPGHFVLLSAQEAETDLGHVLVIGADRSLDGHWRVAELRQLFPDAALVWAHPFRGGRLPAEEKLRHAALDALEIFNRNHQPQENYAALRAWHKVRRTATAGSDAHLPGQVGTFPTLFDHPVTTVAELAAEIRAGHCRPLHKEILRAGSNLTVTELVIGPKGDDEARPRLIIREFSDDRAWERAQVTAAVTEFIAAHGFADGELRVPVQLARNTTERYMVETGQRGKTLHALLPQVSGAVAMKYRRLCARWLAKLHTLPVHGGSEGTREREQRKFASYLRAFTKTHNPHAARAAALLAALARELDALLAGSLARCHGDFHPKNIIFGQDHAHDPHTRFISVIDFGSTLLHHPAFDLGYFAAQFCFQFREQPGALAAWDSAAFLDDYAAAAGADAGTLQRPVALCRARGNLSIAAHLIRVGMGESRELEQLLVESEALVR